MDQQTVSAVSVDHPVGGGREDAGMASSDPRHAAPNEFPAGYKPGWRARRRLDRIAVERAELALRAEEVALEVDLQLGADRLLDANSEYGQPDAQDDRNKSFLRRKLDWARDNRVFLLVATLTLIAGVVIVLLQLGFYRTLKGLVIPLHTWNIPVWLALPLVNEGFTWTFGAMAAFAVKKQQGNPSKYVQYMWVSAGIESVITVSHNVSTVGDFLTGVATGALSLAAPFLWHTYVGMSQAFEEGKTAQQIKQEIRTRILHPIYSFRTMRIKTLLQCEWNVAWSFAIVCTYQEVQKRVKPHLEGRIDSVIATLVLPAEVVPGKVVPRPRQRIERQMPPAPPAPPQQPEEMTVEMPKVVNERPADEEKSNVIDFKLAQEFGDKRGRALAEWLGRLDENDGNGPSYAEVDKKLFGKVTKTTSQAVAAYIEKYGDPRTKVVNE